MNARPVLSICIPTFNRLHYLKESLAALLPQAALHQVEICVSDNHSSDGTARFLAGLAGEGLLRHVAQGSTISLDENMMAAIAMGSGRYIYPIGDDDVLPEGTLSAILRELENECDLLILNGWHTTPSLIPQTPQLPGTIAGRSFGKAADAFVAIWKEAGHQPGPLPLGSFLASRDCFSGTRFERFIGTSHAYAGAAWDALADMSDANGLCRVRCMAEPTVLLRGAEKTWKNNAALITLYEIPLWLSLLAEKEAYREAIPSILNAYLKDHVRTPTLTQFRAIGQLENADVEKFCRYCTRKQARKMRRIAKTPRLLARILVEAHRKRKALSRLLARR